MTDMYDMNSVRDQLWGKKLYDLDRPLRDASAPFFSLEGSILADGPDLAFGALDPVSTGVFDWVDLAVEGE